MICGLILAGMLSISGQTQGTAKKPAEAPRGVPASAENAGDGVWKWKDPQGKSWIYNRTMFGYSRTEDVPDKPAERGAAGAKGLRVVEVNAAQVTFEQATPFGKSRWSRALADMNSDEKAAYEGRLKIAKTAQPAK